MSTDTRSGHVALFESTAAKAPYPIAAACRRYLDLTFEDDWHEWEVLSRDVLGPILAFLSHLLLSDLVATGHKPAQLFHRIESILSRPMAGHYVGFLRETARYYANENLKGGIPELIDFLSESELACTLTAEEKPLLGLLVDLRNLRAHGRFDNDEALANTVRTIRQLTTTLLGSIQFLQGYPLTLEDGTILMGSDSSNLSRDNKPLLLVKIGEMSLRPLLLKLKGRDLYLLEDMEIRDAKLTYRGSAELFRFGKKELKAGDGATILDELKLLLDRVRALDVWLDQPDWNNFSQRARIETDRTQSSYRDMHKINPAGFVPRPEWQGRAGIFQRFLAGEHSLLAISGVQGTGKSALVAHLAQEALAADHAVLFVNAQRFTFAEVQWSASPFPDHFAKMLHFNSDVDARFLRRIAMTAPPGKNVVLFIDGMNEVDGLGAKWNRFRAMELLLEWVGGIVQPGIKIVLSFRMDAYQDYDFLNTDEIPEAIKRAAYCDPAFSLKNNPWVTELMAFDRAQARELFVILQASPEQGMAPDMSWTDLEGGMGENMEEITRNPLLFMIFLRAHHREHRVLVNDTRELFARYAEKLTGAQERKQAPAWRKSLWWLKDGNVTARERFLADSVEKMAELGSASFLIEDLNPKNSRDKRLLRTIEYGNDKVFENLKEGGLFVDEKVEMTKGDEEVTSRRVSVVAELLAVALDPIEKKIRSRKGIRFAVAYGLGLAAAIKLTSAILLHVLVNAQLEIVIARGIQEEVAQRMAGTLVDFASAWVNVLLLVLLPVLLLLVISVAKADTYPSEILGLLGVSMSRLQDEQSQKVALRTMVPLVIVGMTWALVIRALEPNSPYAGGLLLWGPSLGLIASSIYILSPPGTKFLAKLIPRIFPPRVERRVSDLWLAVYASPEARRATIKSIRLSLVSIPIGAVGGGLVFWIQFNSSPVSIRACSLDLYRAAQSQVRIQEVICDPFFPLTILGFGVFMVIVWTSMSLYAPMRARMHHRCIRDSIDQPREKKGEKRLLGMMLLAMTLTATPITLKYYLTPDPGAQVIEYLGIGEELYEEDQSGFLTFLDVSDVFVSSLVLDRVEKNKELEGTDPGPGGRGADFAEKHGVPNNVPDRSRRLGWGTQRRTANTDCGRSL